MREVVISALREWMSELGKHQKVAVTLIAKYKTALQMIALTVLVAYSAWMPRTLLNAGLLLLYAAVILTLWSMCLYLKTAWPRPVTEKALTPGAEPVSFEKLLAKTGLNCAKTIPHHLPSRLARRCAL